MKEILKKIESAKGYRLSYDGQDFIIRPCEYPLCRPNNYRVTALFCGVNLDKINQSAADCKKVVRGVFAPGLYTVEFNPAYLKTYQAVHVETSFHVEPLTLDQRRDYLRGQIKRADLNGFLTLEGTETIEELEAALVAINEGNDQPAEADLVFIFGEGSGNCSRGEKIAFLNDYRDRVSGRGIRPELDRELFRRGSALRLSVAQFIKTSK